MKLLTYFLFIGLLTLSAQETHSTQSKESVNDLVGEDRFNLKFSSGEELTIKLLRKKDGCFDLQSNGAWMDANGKKTSLAIGDLSVISRQKWKSPKTGIIYPARWEVRIPKFKVDVKLEPLSPDQEVQSKDAAYWKGACKISGSHTGKAQVELTGYGGTENRGLKIENRK
jgi:predicted secreted hydrolase